MAFLWSEGFFEEPLHFVGIRQSAPTVKKKKKKTPRYSAVSDEPMLRVRDGVAA